MNHCLWDSDRSLLSDFAVYMNIKLFFVNKSRRVYPWTPAALPQCSSCVKKWSRNLFKSTSEMVLRTVTPHIQHCALAKWGFFICPALPPPFFNCILPFFLPSVFLFLSTHLIYCIYRCTLTLTSGHFIFSQDPQQWKLHINSSKQTVLGSSVSDMFKI